MKKPELFLNDLPNGYEMSGDLAIDTEAMGLKNSRDRLCVVQICDNEGKTCLIQFNGTNYEAPNLKKLLSDSSRQKILHFARFDLAIIYRYLNIILENIYCTKIASRFARTYTDCHGLKALCSELLSVNLSKQQQSSYWGSENLTKQQIDYAASDVIFLHRLRNQLNLMLERENRTQMAQDCFAFLPKLSVIDSSGWEDVEIFSY